MKNTNTSHTAAIHWIGAGLASGPGIVALSQQGYDITLWDMSLERANALTDHLYENTTLQIRYLNLDDHLSLQEFSQRLTPGDIIVSMLPAAFHVKVAKLALSHQCHMVTSSYLSSEMVALHKNAITKGLCLVNEVGLDPGIDHLLTHLVVDAAQKAEVLGQGHHIDFISYCGGVPAQETPFTYKFSWTPLGVLTALTNPAQLIKNGKTHTVDKAWQDVSNLSLNGEIFEVYANRDSLPYISEYGLELETNLQNFVRGTIRRKGWKKAWHNIFATLENATPSDIKVLSDQLWQEHQYGEHEQDRVVLHVALKATPKDTRPWEGSLSLDYIGAGWKSAMAATVSLTVVEAVKAVKEGRLCPGVQAAPSDITEAKIWLKGLKENGIQITSHNVSLNGK